MRLSYVVRLEAINRRSSPDRTLLLRENISIEHSHIEIINDIIPKSSNVAITTYDVYLNKRSYITIGFKIHKKDILEYKKDRGADDIKETIDFETGLNTHIREYPDNDDFSLITFLEGEILTGISRYLIPKEYYLLRNIRQLRESSINVIFT